jgi:hypothetical protein
MQKKLTDSSVTSAVWMQVKALQRENVKIRLVKSNTASYVCISIMVTIQHAINMLYTRQVMSSLSYRQTYNNVKSHLNWPT